MFQQPPAIASRLRGGHNARMLWIALGILLTIVHVVGVALATDAIMTGRTPQGALAWALGLILMPEITVPAYLVFGSRRFEGFVRSRRRGRRGVNRLVAEVSPKLGALRSGDPLSDRVFAPIERLAMLPCSVGNRVDLLIDGQETFDAIFKAIDQAQKYVLAEYYIIRDDEIGRAFRDRLVAAANRGLRVYLIYDGVGSFGLPSKYLQPLRDAGVQIVGFRSFKRVQEMLSFLTPWRRFQINFRNHRKIVVCDGRVALLGGVNVGDEYMGKHHKLTPWRDTHVRLEGPSVLGAQVAWIEDWCCANATIPELDWNPVPCDNTRNTTARVMVVPTGPGDMLETCGLMFQHLFAQANERLWIASPYFVPDESTIHALQVAAMRGVDVRVIIPDMSDSLLVWLSAFSYYDEIMNAGIRLYRFKRGFMHQKVLLVDDIAAVGTANMDNRSFRINFEVTAIIADAGVARRVREMLTRDIERSEAVAPMDFRRRSWPFRLAAKISRLSAPIQ